MGYRKNNTLWFVSTSGKTDLFIICDRSGSGIRFNSSLVPPYLKRVQAIEELLPWLYLRGISTGDFFETLKQLLGPKRRDYQRRRSFV